MFNSILIILTLFTTDANAQNLTRDCRASIDEMYRSEKYTRFQVWKTVNDMVYRLKREGYQMQEIHECFRVDRSEPGTQHVCWDAALKMNVDGASLEQMDKAIESTTAGLVAAGFNDSQIMGCFGMKI